MTLLLQIYFLGTALLLMISVYMIIFNDLTISMPGLNGKLWSLLGAIPLSIMWPIVLISALKQVVKRDL